MRTGLLISSPPSFFALSVSARNLAGVSLLDGPLAHLRWVGYLNLSQNQIRDLRPLIGIRIRTTRKRTTGMHIRPENFVAKNNPIDLEACADIVKRGFGELVRFCRSWLEFDCPDSCVRAAWPTRQQFNSCNEPHPSAVRP